MYTLLTCSLFSILLHFHLLLYFLIFCFSGPFKGNWVNVSVPLAGSIISTSYLKESRRTEHHARSGEFESHVYYVHVTAFGEADQLARKLVIAYA